GALAAGFGGGPGQRYLPAAICAKQEVLDRRLRAVLEILAARGRGEGRLQILLRVEPEESDSVVTRLPETTPRRGIEAAHERKHIVAAQTRQEPRSGGVLIEPPAAEFRDAHLRRLLQDTDQCKHASLPVHCYPGQCNFKGDVRTTSRRHAHDGHD